MTLKAVVTSLDEVPEAVRGEYIEADGRWLLDVEGVDGFALEDVKGLKNALSTQQANARKFKEQLKAFGELSPDDAKKATERIAELEALIDNKGDVEARIKDGIRNREDQLVKKHQQELETTNKRIAFLAGKLEEALVDTRAAEAIREKKGSVALLLPHVKRHVRMNEVNEQFLAQVVDAEGNPRISLKSNSTDPMSISELVEELSNQEEYAPAFAGSGASGGGVPGARSGGGPSTGGKFALTQEQARDVATYRRVRAEAEKAGQKLTILDE